MKRKLKKAFLYTRPIEDDVTEIVNMLTDAGIKGFCWTMVRDTKEKYHGVIIWFGKWSEGKAFRRGQKILNHIKKWGWEQV